MTGPFGPPSNRVNRSSTSSSVRKKCASPGPHVNGRCSRGGCVRVEGAGPGEDAAEGLVEGAGEHPAELRHRLELVERAAADPLMVVICLAKSATWMVTMPLAATGPEVPSPSWTVT